MKNKKGFTLAELTISLAVISIIVVSIMTLTATTLDKNYDRRISYLYKNECQNLINCFIASSFTADDGVVDFSNSEEKLDFYYGLEKEDENYVSKSFRVDDTQITIYTLNYNELFKFDLDVVESYVIKCELYYTLTDVTLSVSVVEVEKGETLFQMLNASVKEVL